MAQCITCGSELHPDRAKKYNYCLAPECQEKNFTGLTMVAVGVNKSADQYLILDERTRDELASGKFRDQRRGSYGTSGASATASASASAAGQASSPAAPAVKAGGGRPDGRHRPARRHPAPVGAPRRPWTRSQERLAVLYNEQGQRPDEIAHKLGLDAYTVTQIILASKNRGKL